MIPDFMQQSLDNAAANAPPWLEDYLEDGRARWEASPMPTRKTEQWKYTSLQSLQAGYAPASDGAIVLADAGIELPRFDGFRLVFVNGHFCPEHSDSNPPAGVSIVRFADANNAQAVRIRHHLGAAVGREQVLFTALNDAALAEGVFLDIEAGSRVEQPVHVMWVSGNEPKVKRQTALCHQVPHKEIVDVSNRLIGSHTLSVDCRGRAIVKDQRSQPLADLIQHRTIIVEVVNFAGSHLDR